VAPPDLDLPEPRPRIAVALGSGAAKGLTYIGVLEELDRHGFEIVALSGSSMGALIGGIYAAGKLDVYRDWVCSLAKLDVLRLVDWTLSGGGLIKGERIIETLRELIGDVDIQDLPLKYTAVATDLDRQREVWLSEGPLFDAIRASIAIPSIFRPHRIHGRRLVDGGLLNPLPVTPLLGATWDYMIAVGANGPKEFPVPTVPARTDDAPQDEEGYRQRIADFIGKLMPHGADKPHEPGALELFNQALDLMQAKLAQLRLAGYQPDLRIEIPANVCTAYEFHRARELVELGRIRARRILADWNPEHLHGTQPSVDDSVST
jgi:NTE family protein